ncbi:MAG TPA: peptidylprolyl isomerase [Balneolaceae bacterium]
MNKAYLVLLFTISICITPFVSQAQEQGATKLDQIVAVVNDHIILKSDIDQQVQQYMFQFRRQNRPIEFGEDLWYTALQNSIDRFIILDKAKRDSIIVSDELVDQRIDQRLSMLIEQIGSEEALEEQLGKSIIQVRADLREEYRQQMTVQRFRQQMQNEVRITRPEVVEYFEQIPQDSLPVIPERVAISQIVAIPPPLENAEEQAFQLAKALRDSILHHGKTLEEMARKYSDGPAASSGGKLPLMSINDLVPEYSAAAAALEPGEISQVVETSFGFHVIRLNRRVGDKIDTNHILITIEEESYNNKAAINELEQLRDTVLTNKSVTFAEIARQYSEDPNTAPQGGRVLNPQTGERFIALQQLNPSLYRIVLLLEEGEVSEPKPFTLGTTNDSQHAYRIVKLDEQVPEHVANLEQDFDRIKQAALRAKQSRVLAEMIRELRKQMYVEYKIPVPEPYKI